jgi:hypothetical protein
MKILIFFPQASKGDGGAAKVKILPEWPEVLRVVSSRYIHHYPRHVRLCISIYGRVCKCKRTKISSSFPPGAGGQEQDILWNLRNIRK